MSVERLELSTSALWMLCSNRLSYTDRLISSWKQIRNSLFKKIVAWTCFYKTSNTRYASDIIIQDGLLRKKSLDLISLDILNYIDPPFLLVVEEFMKFNKNNQFFIVIIDIAALISAGMIQNFSIENEQSIKSSF